VVQPVTESDALKETLSPIDDEDELSLAQSQPMTTKQALALLRAQLPKPSAVALTRWELHSQPANWTLHALVVK
jgi:hypothetical protein